MNRAESHQLRAPGIHGGPIAYLRETWDMRHFAASLGNNAVAASLQSSALGRLWQILEPLLEIATYWLIFGVVLDLSRGIENFVAFLTVGRIIYGYMQRTLLSTAGSVTSQVPMLRSLSFPRMVVPLSQLVRSTILLRSELVVLLVVLPLLGVRPRLSWLLFPLTIVPAAAIATGLGSGLARFVFRMPDLERLLTHLLRLNVYAAGVIFPLSAFIRSVDLQRLALINPFLAVVDIARWAMIGLTPPHPELAVISASAWSLTGVLAGFIVFVRGEEEFASPRMRAG